MILHKVAEIANPRANHAVIRINGLEFSISMSSNIHIVLFSHQMVSCTNEDPRYLQTKH
jgi:hypothetical protein